MQVDRLLDALLAHRGCVGNDSMLLGRRDVAVSADEGELVVERLGSVLHPDVGDVGLVAKECRKVVSQIVWQTGLIYHQALTLLMSLPSTPG